MVVVTIFLLVASLSVICAVAIMIGLSFLSASENVTVEPMVKDKRVATVMHKIELSNYDEASKFCYDMREILPLPQSKTEENELIARVNSVEYTRDCEVFYLGYSLKKDARYESLNGSLIWPSLNVSLAVAQPSPDRDCLEFSFKPLKTVSVKPCRELKSSCFATYRRGESCWRSMTDCLTISTTVGDTDVMSAFKAIKQRDKIVGLAVVDDYSYPYPLFDVHSVYNTCVALAVRNRYEYYAPDGSIMPYSSDRFVSDDSEADCLGMTPGENAFVPAILCDTISCALCMQS